MSLNASLNSSGNPYLKRIFDLEPHGDPSGVQPIYDDWATTYNASMAGASEGYVAPARGAEILCGLLSSPDAVVLDAGCGTGLVGAELARRGAKTIDGVDLSPAMLEVARKTGAYRNLKTANLMEPIESANETYDAVTCVGTLTHGHVGPAAIGEFVRVVRPGGYVVASVLDAVWENGGYSGEVDRLVKEGKAELVSAELGAYRPGAHVEARWLVLRVIWSVTPAR